MTEPTDNAANESFLNRMEELVANTVYSRTEFMKQFMDPRRDYDKECGYPDVITPQIFRQLYDRDAIASRVVDVLPQESWCTVPDIYEEEDPEIITPFEETWDALNTTLRGEYSWFKDADGGGSPVWEALRRADKLSGIGQFGLLLIGFNDGKDLREEVKPKEGMQVLFLRSFDESQIDILRYEVDPTSPRFGMPVAYSINFMDPSNTNQTGIGLPVQRREIHWTRVIHICDNMNSSEVFGAPRMRAVFNRILDLIKLYGGSAEMYWRGAFPGLSVEISPDFAVALKGLSTAQQQSYKDQIQSYTNTLQRHLLMIGATAKTLAPQVVDPGMQIDVQITAICVQIACPKRIFMGSERGELASSQDEGTWNDRLKDRQSNYLTPRIVAPFVDRLIWAKVLPEPEQYYVKWPDLYALSKVEQATVAAQRTAALAQYVQGGLEALIPPMDYFTKVLDFTQDEAEAIIEAAEAHLEEHPELVPPTPEEQQQMDLEMAQAQSDIDVDAAKKMPPKNPPTANYSPDQPRDEQGRWAAVGAGATGTMKEPLTKSQINYAYKPIAGQENNKDTQHRFKERRPGDDNPATNPDGRPTGSYTPERQKLHETIVNEQLQHATPVEKPVAYFMGGGPASGKSSALPFMNLPENIVHVDPDAIKARLPEYQRSVKDKDSSAAADNHEESSDVSKMVQGAGSRGGYNTLLDGTGDSSLKSVESKIVKMKEAGQRVVANYVTVDTAEAVRRSNARAEKTGRKVPESYIESCHRAVSQIVPQAIAKGLFDEFNLYDTNGNQAVKIASGVGTKLTIHNEAAWAKFLAKGQ